MDDTFADSAPITQETWLHPSDGASDSGMFLIDPNILRAAGIQTGHQATVSQLISASQLGYICFFWRPAKPLLNDAQPPRKWARQKGFFFSLFLPLTAGSVISKSPACKQVISGGEAIKWSACLPGSARFAAKIVICSVLSGIASLGWTWTGHLSIISEFAHCWSQQQLLQLEVWRCGWGGIHTLRIYIVTAPPHGYWRWKKEQCYPIGSWFHRFTR